MSITELEFLTPEELAEKLKVSLPTIYRWRARGSGPRAVKVGGQLRYPLAAVEAWLANDGSEPAA